MTGHGDVPMSVRAMKAGAVDFLTKPFRDQDMLDAVAAADRGGSPPARDDEAGRDVRTRFESLSPREREVMTLVTRGLMNKQVAGELGLSEITVKLYRGAGHAQDGRRSLADLVRMAEQLALHKARRLAALRGVTNLCIAVGCRVASGGVGRVRASRPPPLSTDARSLAAVPPRSSAPTIAVVDDDESVREALGNLLMSMGLEVQAFGTAEDFLASPYRNSAACLVSDIQLPGMGAGLQRRIVEAGKAPPIVLITAFPRDHVRRQAEQQGAVALLAKPFDGGRPVECVQRALQPRRGLTADSTSDAGSTAGRSPRAFSIQLLWAVGLSLQALRPATTRAAGSCGLVSGSSFGSFCGGMIEATRSTGSCGQVTR